MARNNFNPALFSPSLLWADVAIKTTEMLVSSGQVIGTRVICSDAARLASAALKPVHAASTANARRLARLRTHSKAKR